jgi:hypothetical protein
MLKGTHKLYWRKTAMTEQSIEKRLEEIARSYTKFGDLKTRDNDGEDFKEVSVWSLREALRAAYEAGRQAK